MSARTDRKRDLQLVDQVDALNEEVKVLALNLAIYLAKAEGNSEQLARLEPDFIRLVNGTVKVVRELAVVINAARNLEHGEDNIVPGTIPADQIEIRLRSILDQCSRILNSLARTGKLSI
jgi:hypothetical protein